MDQEVEGWSAFMIASQNGYGEVVKLLLENDAKVDLQRKSGNSVLMIAIQSGNTDIITKPLLSKT